MMCERSLTECKRHQRVIAYPSKEISSYVLGSAFKKSCVPKYASKTEQGRLWYRLDFQMQTDES